MNQGRSESHAATLTAGQAVDLGVQCGPLATGAQVVDADTREHRTDARVAGPFVLRHSERPQDHFTDSGAGRQHTALRHDGHTQSADAADASRIRLLHTREDFEHGRLTATVETDDADALALLDAQGDPVEQRLDAERLRHVFQIDQIRHQCCPFAALSSIRAPGTGPLATRTVRHTPAPASSALTSTADCASAQRKAHVGPEPETMPAKAPASTPARSVRRRSGLSESAAACRSLPSSGASR